MAEGIAHNGIIEKFDITSETIMKQKDVKENPIPQRLSGQGSTVVYITAPTGAIQIYNTIHITDVKF